MLPNTPEPRVVEIMRAQRLSILGMEEAEMRRLATAWVQVEDALRGEIALLVAELESGRTLSATQLQNLSRYQRLLAQAEARTRDFAEEAGAQIGDYQRRLGALGIEHATNATRAVYADAAMLGTAFDILPVDAIEALIGLTGNGTPLAEYFMATYPNVVSGVTQTLINGVAQGWEPRSISAQLVNVFGIPYKTAIVTARTEPLRVYRFSSLEQYRHSGVVEGYKRLSAHDGRVCAGCLLAEDGTVYPLDAPFDEHPQGRCSALPVVIGVPQTEWVSGADWLVLQDESIQRSVLGNARFDAWQDGANLNEMVTQRSDPVWGGSFVPTPLKNIVN